MLTLHEKNHAYVLQNLETEKLGDALYAMHKSVNGVLSDSREKAVTRHNARTGVHSYNLSGGDYVVVSRMRGPRTKMSANWIASRRFTQALSDIIFRVEYLLTKYTKFLHVSRIRHYSDSLVGSSAEMEEIANFNDCVWFAVNKINDVRKTRVFLRSIYLGRVFPFLETHGNHLIPCSKMFHPKYELTSTDGA